MTLEQTRLGHGQLWWTEADRWQSQTIVLREATKTVGLMERLWQRTTFLYVAAKNVQQRSNLAICG